MKKLFAILAIAGALVACNNNSNSVETTADTSSSSYTTTDSTAISTPVVIDSANNADGTNTTIGDSTK